MGLFGKKKGTELMITASPMSHKGGILDTTQNLSALKMKEKPFDKSLTVRFDFVFQIRNGVHAIRA